MRRTYLQLGLLTGIGLAFVVASEQRFANAGGDPMCVAENACSFKRPNVMLIVDYSTSMNTLWDLQNNLTRWEVVVAAIEQVTTPGSFLSQNTHLALLRFGHDPVPAVAGSTIPNDGSGLVDGQALDVAWDDPDAQYFDCPGQSIIDALEATPPPMMGALVGIGSWTKGALDRAAMEIDQTKADHPEDQQGPNVRAYVNVVLTDGVWTGADGNTPLAPANQDPALTASALYDDQGIPTYVVAVAGDPQAEAAADELAAAGGTAQAIDGETPMELAQAFALLVADLADAHVVPECMGGQPRVMILLDASSSMLNINGGAQYGAMGQTGWDQAREALAGADSLFDVELGLVDLEDVTQLGLAVFGHNMPGPGEQKILVQYGPCMKENFAWALDPVTSCELPGCTDPWGGPPIAWTFEDGTLEPPFFTHPTQSHMPRCDGQNAFCVGSGTYTHLGLQLIANNQMQYQQAGLDPMAQYPTTPATPYINILITDGQYTAYSTDAQVQAELEAMYASGITTYVIGFGDAVDFPAAITQLQNMADWGSGGLADYYDAPNQAELELALATILGELVFDPCCVINECSPDPQPTGDGEGGRDPVPDPTTGDGDGDGDGDPSTGDGDGDGDGDPSAGDGDPSTGDGDGDPTTAGDGDGESSTEGGVGEGESSESGETDGAPAIQRSDEGCSCRTHDGGFNRNLLGTALLLGLLGLVRRRER